VHREQQPSHPPPATYANEATRLIKNISFESKNLLEMHAGRMKYGSRRVRMRCELRVLRVQFAWQGIGTVNQYLHVPKSNKC